MLWAIKEKNGQVVFRKEHNGEYSDETIMRSENGILEKLEATNDRTERCTLETEKTEYFYIIDIVGGAGFDKKEYHKTY